jgi:hypothetical protein
MRDCCSSLEREAAGVDRPLSAPVDRAAEGLRLRGIDRATREERFEGVAQIRSPDLRGDPAVVSEPALTVDQENLGGAPGVQESGQTAVGVPDNRKRVTVLCGVRADVVLGFPSIAVDGEKENALRAVLRGHLLQELVVGVRVRTERRPKYHDDRAMTALRFAKRERVALDGRRGEGRNGGSDLEPGRGGGGEQREKRGGQDAADGLYSVESPDEPDFRAKLRITRLGEKPQINPTASPGWISWTFLPHTIDWYEANTSTVPVMA